MAPSGLRDSIRVEIHRPPVDAVALMRRRRAVGEAMAEMTAAAAAVHLGAHHAVAAVRRRFDRTRLGIVEARPARPALEFALGDEQLLSASRAGECAGALLEVQRAASRRLGAVLAHDVKLLWREQLAPLSL